MLGLTERAKKAAIDEFTDYGDERFLWFWKARNDWIPDLDNGGTGMMTLQLMLMQTDGKRIQLLPAWPVDWTAADFKLHVPYRTTVEGPCREWQDHASECRSSRKGARRCDRRSRKLKQVHYGGLVKEKPRSVSDGSSNQYPMIYQSLDFAQYAGSRFRCDGGSVDIDPSRTLHFTL